jgi:CheY-like chemotaxis protein
VQEGIPPVIIGDVVRLRQILLNLIGNSIKFTEKGSVEVDVQLKEQHGDDMILLFTIKDTGIGIPEDKQSLIFESFTQASNDTTRKFGGTGLGLTIVKQLVELQSGTISLESMVNKGTSFFVSLPFKKGFSADQPMKIIDDTTSFNELENARILLVEDNSLNQMVAKKILSKWHVNTDVAENGKVAIDKIAHSDYDAVLMDIQMPEMDGYDATKYIRKKMPAPKSDIPIIAMTACAMVGEADRCLEIGMNDYISKPFDQKVLYEKIVQQVKRKNSNGSTKKNENMKTTATETKDYTDLTYLKDIASGSNDFIREMLETFMSQTPPLLESMEKYLAEKKWKELSGLAHKMKPTIDFIGIHSIRETVKNIEDYSRAETNLDALPAMLSQVKEVCLRAIEELKAELPKYK